MAPRPIRFLNIALAAALFVTPYVYDADMLSLISSIACGILLLLLSLRRGPVRGSYDSWEKLLV